jgi:hypothetical protein
MQQLAELVRAVEAGKGHQLGFGIGIATRVCHASAVSVLRDVSITQP